MKNYFTFSILIAGCILSSLSYADYDKSCLDDCFRTGHECNFCNYECYRENVYKPMPNYSGDSTCPLQGYNDNH